MFETISEPERILAGGAGEKLAVRKLPLEKWLVVVYREFEKDGFIITAFLTRKIQSLNKREQRWPITDIQDYLKLIPAVRRSPQGYLWSSYDQEADTLYINFKKPSQPPIAN